MRDRRLRSSLARLRNRCRWLHRLARGRAVCFADGHRVTGIDNFDPYYARDNQGDATCAEIGSDTSSFRFVEGDLARRAASRTCSKVSRAIVQPGGAGGCARVVGPTRLPGICANNVQATQHLLEALPRPRPRLQRYVYGGKLQRLRGRRARSDVSEDFTSPAPHSPYGLTKLAAEQLGRRVYRRVFDVPVCTARIFSCYGPRERPDKAIQKFMLKPLQARRADHAVRRRIAATRLQLRGRHRGRPGAAACTSLPDRRGRSTSPAVSPTR